MKRSVLFSLVVIIAAMSVMTVSAASPHGRYYDQMGNKYWCNSDSYGCWVTNENGGKDYIMFWSEAAAEAIMGTNSGAPIGTFPGTSELSLEAPIPEVVVKEGSAPSPAPVDKCKDVTCPDGETCNKETGECESNTPVDKCKDVKCESGQTCNAETGQCEAETPVDKCAGVTCEDGKTCNADTGFCETASGGMGSCTTDEDCESGYACLVGGLGGTCTRTTGWSCDANSCPASLGMSCNEYNWCLKTSCTEEDKAVVGACEAPKSYKVINLSCTCSL